MSSSSFHHPENFDFTKPELWAKWIRRFERYRSVSGLSTKDDAVQVDALLYCMGDAAEDILNTLLPIASDERKKYSEVKAKFDSYFVVKKNIIYERARFNRRVQQEGEPVDAFITDLHAMSESCEYGSLREDLVRDRIVVGLRDQGLSEDLQKISDLTVKKATDMARQCELVKKQQLELRGKPEASASVEAVKSKPRDYATQRPSKKPCWRCSKVHDYSCPAKNARCRACRKVGHYSICCKEVQTIVEEPEDLACESLFIGHVNNDVGENEPPWFTDLSINRSSVKFKLDSGADVSIMSHTSYTALAERPALKPCYTKLRSPGGEVKSLGQFIARVAHLGSTYNMRIIVVPNESAPTNLLSRAAAVNLQLIKRIENIDNDVFGNCGKLKCPPVKIQLKDDAIPYCVTAPRRVPFPLIPKVEEELRKLQSMDIIEPVTEPSDWCAPIVCVPRKNDKLRICVDLTRLNRAVKRERFLIPTIDDILPKLTGARVFSKLDAVTGFHQLELDSESSKLTCFMTPLGRFRYKRLCFGISSAPEIFQREMSKVLEGVEGVVVLMDDILCYGQDMQSHDRALQTALQRIRESGLKLNKDKCIFRQSSVVYFGHSVSEKGIQPDPHRIKAIRELKPPTNVTELRRFLGMVNFVGRYLPNLSTLSEPILGLLKSDTTWIWDAIQQRAYDRILDTLSSAESLAFYDPTKPTVVSADASSFGLGGALWQWHDTELRVVAYCSRTLTPAERKYAQIEKELLASTWACEKFTRYLVGLDQFELQTDHRPLVPLINQMDIDRAPARCQRLLLRLMRFTALAKYVPGKDMAIADNLSRNPLPTVISSDELELADDVEAYIASMQMCATSYCGANLEALRTESQRDSIIRDTMSFTLDGWPSHEQDVTPGLEVFFKERGRLSVCDGLLLFGSRIVIPAALRDDLLQRLHEGHQGYTKCLARAQSSIWWPGLSAQLRRFLEGCQFCNENRPSHRREPLMPRSLPARPWQRIAADLCDFKGKQYMVVYDEFSGWLEIMLIPRSDTATIIERLNSLFARYGIPDVLTTDNGPCFASYEFRRYAEFHGFSHSTSSPYWAPSNGAAERAVGIAKRILRQDNIFQALTAYRTTPHTATGVSPARLFLGRELNTRIPVVPQSLTPEWPDFDAVRQHHEQYKSGMKSDYDRRHGARPLPELKPGDKVVVKTDKEKQWTTEGTIQRAADEPRSYIISAENGDRDMRRNRRHINYATKPLSGDAKQPECPDVPEQPDAPGAAPDPPSDGDTPPDAYSDNEPDTCDDNSNEPVVSKSKRQRRRVFKYQAGFT